MVCKQCDGEMKCYDDVRTDIVSIDWYKCEKCGARAEVSYKIEYIYHLDKVRYLGA